MRWTILRRLSKKFPDLVNELLVYHNIQPEDISLLLSVDHKLLYSALFEQIMKDKIGGFSN